MKRYGKNDMIKFILLLPFKIIGVIFLAIGAILERREKERIQAARENEKRIAAAQREQERRERAARIATERAQRSARIEQERRRKQAEKARAETFKADQARTDMEHYKIQRSELLKLYNEIERQYSDAATDSKKEIAFRKMIALNNQIRGVDRQIEKAQYTINRTG